MNDKNLICPVRRLEKPKVDINIEQGKDNLLNIKADISIKNPIIEAFKFINKYIIKKN